MRKLLAGLFFLSIGVSVKCQTTTAKDTTKKWTFGGVATLNFSQVAIINWVAGGQNSATANSLFNLHINYKEGSLSWDNNFDVGYGVFRKYPTGFVKTDDHIDISSKLGKVAFGDWNYSALINFKTQFSAGYNDGNDSTVISDFLAPGYGLFALGLDYKPNEDFTVLFAPLTTKLTIVNIQSLADAGAFGVDPAIYDDAGTLIQHGDNLRKEAGGYIKLALKRKLMENVGMQIKAEAFSNYLNKPQNIDVSGELLVILKVNKFISATILANMIYDDDIRIPVDDDSDGVIDREGPRTQFKEVLGVGLTYKF